MENSSSNHHIASSILLVLLLVLVMSFGQQQAEARAFFVFGDSLVDNGNNNYLATTARADSPPYGIDYPTHRPTGRFSNGLNMPDLISEQIGSEPTLPYLSPELTGERLLVGANFASAGIGILNDTGFQFRLYELGARRVLVTGTGPLGCVPAELAQRGRNGQCAVELQRAAALFNPQLVDIINSLNSEIGSNVFMAANAFNMHMDFISNPQAYGFETSKIACCGQGPFNGIGLCTPVSNLCPNRDAYVFWDAFHPSERANRIIVQQILEGSNKYMHPMNLSTMMALDSART
ncbi:hypothetical protein F8388_012699 [Cannabis sativa]|uniref:GDSL esterase/lipase n=1 Tax=Cannabis sativa TaxID=3483 RepID=A0A7J6DU51_CANSA|nr:hypothetical protein G4B88_000892 [Cannabis sativa]KAF4392243.1 hypothetical protein F8388_012699 [Cannabis sativa]